MRVKILFISFLILIIFFALFLVFTTTAKLEVVYSTRNKFEKDEPEMNILFLGKPGRGYIGSENTDTIFVIHFKAKNNKRIYIISIPRDLVVYDRKGNLVKINMLYGRKETETLLKAVSNYTGLNVKKYIVFDLHLVKKITDALGGIQVNLDYPVIDALSLYTIPPGKRLLKGDDLELVLRSRYNPEGDFFRIKNQVRVLEGLKNKLVNLENKEKISLLRLVLKNKHHWESNLTLEEIYSLVTMGEELKNAALVHILFDTRNGFLTSGYFLMDRSNGVYGIFPKLGINNFSGIREYLRSQIEN